MKIERIVGERIRIAREAIGYSQPELGRRVGEALDKATPRQAVSAFERGERAFTASELFVFAQILRVPVSSLFTPPSGVGEVEVSSGTTYPTTVLDDLRVADNPAQEALYDLERLVDELTEANSRKADDATRERRTLSSIHALLIELHKEVDRDTE
ncbi:helix-turn-helix transcriptional regulator [Nocardia puris]|uniref:helix-turn-helix transcriptional regulator n=1 Tax=Nocardia puris TaxID=208602 RepID=UPI001895C8DC|nr:helix-turn-helix transcriptional regulator [Nocardia puris]MBF6216055.1 helix-turn-helix transcriptional regulator [Nocardia puris]MBF6366047.1 helix-turn-helix transcriptional regulator [Nocardia puris]MBF6460310.1 helix-turn-helix transcriptional regulator [Nocardia puris]